MSPETPIRPEFERPPLIEQAISVAFEPIEGFRIVDYGLFWQQIAEEFPKVTAEERFESPRETFGDVRPAQTMIRIVPPPTMPRAMFRNVSGELVQVQADWFSFNWTKEDGRAYPRSEQLMDRFQDLYQRFCSFVERSGLGEIRLRQCELTNLNIFPVSDFGRDFADMTAALKVDTLELGLDYLRPETYVRNRQHRIVNEAGEPIGRLHTEISPVFRNDDGSKAFKLEFTARSAPNVHSFDAAMHFFGIARNSINGAFLAITTDRIRAHWGEKNG